MNCAGFQVYERLIIGVNNLFYTKDKEFILSFENGEPKWEICCAGDLSKYPSVQWKLENIRKLKTTNPNKFKTGLSKLEKNLLVWLLFVTGFIS